ncbi:phage tail assembly chaperone family protein, TAC [Pseudomonas sp. SWRI12]|uniref:Phage tail assembly chaperone family protein, TAC n=1 Tax=Pseudomonas zanjanensis TaxID=2745496 RepID=A0A923FF96_9PSED|nr:phage tail assembly chaperone family protein, TAC [Pseudomonas zanjanensis]MBV4496375.1 phage tail assembly chaperone family protein, TAC [Pseudomonas zanjanensis]
MDLSIAALAAAGAFAAPPVKKEIQWHSGGKLQKATVYVAHESYISVTQRWDAQNQGGDITAQRIASCIVDKDGKPVFTVADVVGGPDTGHGALCAELAIVLLAAIGEVNKVPEGALEKKSTPRKSSGTSSSSRASAAVRSGKQSKT